MTDQAPPPVDTTVVDSNRPEEGERFLEVDDVAETLKRVHGGFLRMLILAYAAAAGAGVATVFIHPVRDWILFVGMFLVILAYMSAYLKAHQNRRPILKLIGFLTTEALIGFWMFILADRIPPRRVFVDGEIIMRPEMTELWVSVGLLGAVALGLLVHYVWVGRFVRLRKQAATVAATASEGSGPE